MINNKKIIRNGLIGFIIIVVLGLGICLGIYFVPRYQLTKAILDKLPEDFFSTATTYSEEESKNSEEYDFEIGINDDIWYLMYREDEKHTADFSIKKNNSLNVELAYQQEGIYLCVPEVDQNYYFMDWQPDVFKKVSESKWPDLLGVKEDQIKSFSEMVDQVRNEILSDKTTNNQNLLNKVFHLTFLEVDAEDLFKNIEISKCPDIEKNFQAETQTLKHRRVYFPQNVVNGILSSSCMPVYLQAISPYIDGVDMDMFLDKDTLKELEIRFELNINQKKYDVHIVLDWFRDSTSITGMQFDLQTQGHTFSLKGEGHTVKAASQENCIWDYDFDYIQVNVDKNTYTNTKASIKKRSTESWIVPNRRDIEDIWKMSYLSMALKYKLWFDALFLTEN